ncbi:MAG: LytTR family DNA-binding domain-containing protein [Candidatus Krumholzibacteriia bacterium]
MPRILLNIDDGLKEVVDPTEVYYLEALDGETKVRLRRSRAHVDVREFGELLSLFEPYGFMKIHRSFAVNLDRIRQLRRRSRGRDWEVKLEPPVNRILPVSREVYPDLLAALEEGPNEGRPAAGRSVAGA